MKSFFIGTLLLSGACCIAQPVTKSMREAGNAPAISFGHLLHDFGNLPQGVPGTYLFTFKNTGKAPLFIKEAVPSSANFLPEPILPGKTGAIKVVFNTEGRQGSFYKTIHVRSNARNGNVELAIKGNVIAPQAPVQSTAVFFFPNGTTHDFGDIPEGPYAEYCFEFRNTGREPLIIQNVSSSCGCLVPGWPKDPIPPGKTGCIKATYGTQGRPGVFTKTLNVRSNATEQNLILTVKGRVLSAPDTLR